MAKASKKEDETKKPKVVKKKPSLAKTAKKQQTVRERTQSDSNKPRRLRKTAGKVKTPLKKVNSLRKREYHVVSVPDNKVGRILQKRVRIVPRWLSEAWSEIRQVTWPNMRETISLTIAVFIFAVVFAAIVGILDYGLGKLFKEVIIK